jgi:FixJ family two-component response regulator
LLDACGCASIAFASGQALLERWPIADVGCLMLDLRLPGMSGLEIQARLAAMGAVPPVVFMTGHGDVASGIEAMKRGAVDFLSKPVEHDVLVGVLRDAMARGTAEREHAAARDRCRHLVARLSPRERDVAVQVVRGRLNKQIAADLGISEQTVKQHRGRVMEKLEVRSVARLVQVWELAEGADVAQHMPHE